MTFLSLPTALLIVAAAEARAAGQSPAPKVGSATTRYRKGLEDSRSNEQVNVEQLFALATAAAKEIEQEIVKRDETGTQGAAAREAPAQMDGLVISTEEALFAKPAPNFFLALAKKKGRPVDRDFFELLMKTRPDGAWPVYVEQQTDATGCTRFENPDLVSIYKGWLEFQKRSPTAYQAQVTVELRDLENQLLTSTCACANRTSVIKGLQRIIAAFPNAPMSEGIKKRLEKIRAGTLTIRFRCTSG